MYQYKINFINFSNNVQNYEKNIILFCLKRNAVNQSLYFHIDSFLIVYIKYGKYEKLKSALLILVVLIELLLVLFIVLLTHVQIEFQFLKHFKFQLMKMCGVDSSSKLVCFIVIVKIILKFGGQEDRHEHHFVHIKIVESEVLQLHVVSIDIDDR